jgi:hypothetical protein
MGAPQRSCNPIFEEMRRNFWLLSHPRNRRLASLSPFIIPFLGLENPAINKNNRQRRQPNKIMIC